ncbi:MAG: Gldg family protein [Planctomycetes bacterium]|nr:Gldg family protein [Planctomycetota bacterium]
MINRRRNYTLHFYLMATLVAIALGAINYLGMEYRTRLDLTGDHRFTLSEGTQRLFEKLTEPINVVYYVDDEPPAKRINLERDVLDKLDELSVSSAGKLQYRVERITNDEVATRRKELDDKGVKVTVDVQTSGQDERSEVRGVQGYFSSLEVNYGTAEPKVINGIVNLVDKADESREHRVDTLEFDIAYTVLTMRNETKRPTFERLLKSFEKPVRIACYVTEPMPDAHREMAANLNKALDAIAQTVPEKVTYQRVPLAPSAGQQQKYPFGAGYLNLQPFDGKREPVFDDNGALTGVKDTLYFAAVIVQVKPDEDKFGAIWDFSEKKTEAEIKTAIEDNIWEQTRPRTRLGFVLPPSDPRAGPPQPGQMPQNGHTPLLNYIKGVLDYDTVWVDLKTEKRVPRDLACLIVMEANRLSERELYEIERYLNEGGNVALLVQGWSADIDFSMSFTPPTGVTIKKEPLDPTFEEWAKHLGIEFGQDLLLRPNGKLQPYAIRGDPRRGQSLELVPTTVRLAPVIEPKDLNATSVFTRGLASLPLPLVVEETVKDDRLKELDLERTDLITLKDDAYKFMPANPAMPEIPVKFNLNSPAEVERDPAAKPGKGILAQKLDHGALVATLLSGKFPSFWVDEKRKVPGWSGDPEAEEAQPVLNPREGKLLVMTTASALNVDYLRGYPQDEIEPVVISHGLTFYRNIAEAFIYGDDLVSLRARTGVAPRIVGPIDQGTKTFWFMVCIAGVPLILLAFAGVRSFMRGRDRELYEIGIGIRDSDK